MNNGDLISRKAMINMCKEVIALEWNHKAAPASWAHAYESFVDSLETAPTVDAVEVVRCGVCAYFMETKVNEKGFLICPASSMEITELDYCSYGERRSE